MDKAIMYGPEVKMRIDKIKKSAPWAKDIKFEWKARQHGVIEATASAKIHGGKVTVRKADYSLEATLDMVSAALKKRLMKMKKNRGPAADWFSLYVNTAEGIE